MMNVDDIRYEFRSAMDMNKFTIDRTGAKTIEILGASFLADEPAIFGVPNLKYIEAELEWYESQVPNINRLAEIYGCHPAAWASSADENGNVNSNYGYLVFSTRFYNQFARAVAEIQENPDSRRAQMIYNRPSIWVEFDENGKNDFICTNAQTVYIRDGKLHMVSQMRSNDVVYGYKNDRAWARHLQAKFVQVLNSTGRTEPLEMGDLIWQCMNLHVYSRHFDLIT